MLPVDVGVEPAAQRLDTKLNASIHNRFDIEVVNAETGEVKQRAQAENVICNQLWTRMFVPNTYFNYIHYGTGSGTPSAANTSLFTFLGYGTPATGDDVYTYDWNNCWASLRRKIQLSESTAVGSALTEVGIGYSTGASSLCTHAMLKDMNGNVISIAKTSTDIINIYATVFLHWSVAGYDNANIKIFPMPRSAEILYLLGMSSSAFGSVVFSAGAISSWYSPISSRPWTFGTLAKTYSSANKTITLTATRLAAASANVGGIKAIGIGTCVSDSLYPYIVLEVGGSWFSGTAITGEAIGTGDGSTVNFATDFPLLTGTPKIYIDGVEQTTGVTVDLNKPTLFNTDDGAMPLEIVSGLLYGDQVIPTYTGGTVSGQETIYYNPYYALYGIASFTARNCNVKVSNDLITWTTVTSPVSASYKNYKYWKLTATSTTNVGLSNVVFDGLTAYNIHFTVAPASGAVITADYTTKTIAKDANHVFDFSLTIQFGEHTG